MKRVDPKKTDERKNAYFDQLPKDMEIIIFSFVISNNKQRRWRRERNWCNISLVSKHWNLIAWIVFQRIITKSRKETIFIQGCEKGWFHFINKFLTQDTTFDLSFQDNEAIQEASYYGRSDIAKLLLQDKRVDPSVNNNYAIRYSSENGFVDIVKLLLKDKRVDPSDNVGSAIGWASLKGHVDVVKLLLQDKRVDPAVDNNFAIRVASSGGYIDVVKFLLQDKRVDPSTATAGMFVNMLILIGLLLTCEFCYKIFGKRATPVKTVMDYYIRLGFEILTLIYWCSIKKWIYLVKTKKLICMHCAMGLLIGLNFYYWIKEYFQL